MPDVEPVLSTVPLLLIAVGAVLVLLFLIMKVKLHAFVALILVSLLTALATGINIADVVETMVEGFGKTLGSVALLVGLGAMLGRLLETSGGAQVLADTLIGKFGEKRAPLALGVTALVFGFPIFFDAGLVVLLPIVFNVARRLGGSVLLYALPVAGAFAVMHAFVPPHPGPVAAAELLGADVGLSLIFGLVVGIPTWFLGGYLYGTFVGKRIDLPVPTILGGGGTISGPAKTTAGADNGGEGAKTTTATAAPEAAADSKPGSDMSPPAFGTIIGVLLLPLVLIFLNTGLTTLGKTGAVSEDNVLVQILIMLGQTPVALLISVLVAMWVLGWRRGRSGSEVEGVLNDALGPVCAIILITGAGGMFGGVLRASGIGTALANTLESVGLPVIVAAFLISVCLRVAQGSATVALITTAGLVAPLLEASDLSSADRALTVIAIAGGATVLSHVNDSGFWLVGRFLGMDVKTTLRTWTVMETLLGTIAFVFAFALSLVF